jgi:RNA polymerase sigma-70 factor, ECF subfamily
MTFAGSSMDELANRADSELLELSLAGDENAFVALYERLKGSIFRYAFYMTNSQTAAEEVTQEVFISLLKQGKRYQSEQGAVAAFAFGIARNFVRRIRRREHRYEPLPNDDLAAHLASGLGLPAETLSRQMIHNERAARVQSAIASLPDHYRQAVVLCDLCELSYAEAADRLNCAIGTVRSRLNRAHSLLTQKLKSLKTDQREIGPAGTEECVI